MTETTKAKRGSKSKGPSIQEIVVPELKRRRDGEHAYPTVAELAQLCGQPADKFASKLTAKALKPLVVVAKKLPSAPVALAEDAQTFAGSEQLLRFAVTQSTTAAPWVAAAFAKEVKLGGEVKDKFAEALGEAIEGERLPSDLRGKFVLKLQKPPTVEELVVRELRRRRDSREPYATVTELAARCGQPADTFASKLTAKALKPLVVVAKKLPSAPVALAEDAQTFAGSEQVLRFAVTQLLEPAPWTAKDFIRAAKLDASINKKFGESLGTRIENGSLPADLRGSFPVKTSPEELGRRLLAVLQSVKPLPESYPTEESQLLKLCDVPDAISDRRAGLKAATFTKAVVSCKIAGKVLYALAADSNALTAIAGAPSSLAAAFAFAETKKAKGQTVPSTAFSIEDLAAALGAKTTPLYQTFVAAVTSQIASNKLPREFGALTLKGKPILFRLSSVGKSAAAASAVPSQLPRTAATTPASTPSKPDTTGFAQAFDAAFSRLLGRSNGRNLIKVYDLRRELTNFSREAFDRGLRELREQDKYRMNHSDGNVVQLTDEERAAGILEGGSLLVYVLKNGGARG